MPKVIPIRAFLHPKNWFASLGLSLLWLITRLPWAWQMQIGKGVGLLLYKSLHKRRQIACINLEIAYPHKSNQEREALNRQHFIAMAQGIVDAALAWWGSDKKLNSRLEVSGIEHVEQAIQAGHGIILVGVHLASIEMGGRIFSQHHPVNMIYRANKHALIDDIITRSRYQFGQPIANNNIRDMIKCLKNKEIAWYAPDQGSTKKNAIMSPFYGTPAMTNSGTARIVKMTNAVIMSCCTYRTFEKDGITPKGYQLSISEPLTDFPADDVEASVLYLNTLFQGLIDKQPQQYFWSHKRYKREDEDFYQSYLGKKPDSHCS